MCQKILRAVLLQINSQAATIRNYWQIFTIRQQIQRIIKLIEKTQFFSFKFPKNTEISKLYFFTSPGEKIRT